MQKIFETTVLVAFAIFLDDDHDEESATQTSKAKTKGILFFYHMQHIQLLPFYFRQRGRVRTRSTTKNES
jgi:hypothetical protein